MPHRSAEEIDEDRGPFAERWASAKRGTTEVPPITTPQLNNVNPVPTAVSMLRLNVCRVCGVKLL